MGCLLFPFLEVSVPTFTEDDSPLVVTAVVTVILAIIWLLSLFEVK